MADTFTQAEGRNWHKEHFCCEVCDDPLQGKTYSQSKSDGRVLCQRCYDRHAAPTCKRCLLTIVLGEVVVIKNDLSFHEKCFVCKRCRESLSDRKFFFSEDDCLCEECMQPAAQCSACKQGILPSVQYMKYKSRAWHADCFCCITCNVSLVGKGFQDYDANVMCQECYAQKVSKKCLVCFEPIIGAGLQYNFSWYHQECFRCNGCGKILSREKVVDKQGQQFCQDCIARTAKRCYACKGPITSRHTIYQGHTYHLNCFKCTECGIAVGNKAFYQTSLMDILCERCASKD